jgi:hypothetical protein
MERGIEARHLGDVWRDSADHPDRREVVWLVKRCQRRQLFQLVEDRVVDQHGRRELLAAMDDSMADRHDAQVIRVPGDPLVEDREQCRVVAGTDIATRERLVDHVTAVGIGHEEPGVGSNALDGAPITQPETLLTRIHGEHRELDARRSRVEDEDDVRHHATMRARCTTANRASRWSESYSRPTASSS